MQQKRRPALLYLLFFLAMPLWPQAASPAGLAGADEEQNAPGGVSSYIGIKLDELIERFGVPQSVYSSRGQELWQDDVVFVYDEGDFYIFKDRVWQLRVKSAGGVSAGESKPAVFLILGENAADYGDFILCPLPSAGWPLMLRVNFNSTGRVSELFIYRPDF